MIKKNPSRPASTTPYGETSRLNVVIGILLAAGLGLVGRLIWLQVKTSDELIERGYERSLRTKTEDALRGMIIDREGEALAISTPVSTVIADPQRMWKTFTEAYELLEKNCPGNPSYSDDCGAVLGKNKTLAAFIVDKLQPLAEVIGENPKDLYDTLHNRRNTQYYYLARQVQPSVAEEALALKLPNIRQEDSYKRYYPAGDIISYVIGYTNIDDKGQEGLEKLYDARLAGQTGKVKVLQDPKGHALRVVEEVTPTSPGQPLQLSIDKRIQYITHQELSKAREEFHAKSASAVMVKVKTGEILAMATVPSGNPNNTSERRAEFIKNRTITDTFEPGSTMKPLAVAAALEAGVITPHTMFKKGRTYKMGRNTVTDTHNYGNQDVIGIIRKSSNVGMAQISEKLPREKHYQMMRAFGFGQPTGIDFPGEQVGVLHDSRKLSPFAFATTTFGYAISVNAVQLAHAYATLANNGIAVPLTLMKADHDPEGKRIISEKTAKAVQEMLKEVVSNAGTGRRAETEGFSVSGKTGTSHKVSEKGGYSKTNYYALFAGYAPSDDPQVALVVVFDDPQGQHYGGLVAAPVFSKIIEWSLNILGVLPDKISKTDNITLEADPKIIENKDTKDNDNGKKPNET